MTADFVNGDSTSLDWPTVYRTDLFEGRVVLASGGGSGLGKITPILFGRPDARGSRDGFETVALWGRDAEWLF